MIRKFLKYFMKSTDQRSLTKERLADQIYDYITHHCFIYPDDNEDDPSLLPNGKHPYHSVKDLATFKKYFKIVPKSELGFTINKTKRGE